MVMALLRAGADLDLLDEHYREHLFRLVENAEELIAEGQGKLAVKKPAAKRKPAKKKSAKKSS